MADEQLPVARSDSPPLEQVFQAIADEIAAASTDASRTIDVYDGKRLHRSIGGSLYSFRADAVVQVQPETPITLTRDDERVNGTLIVVEDFDVVVQLREDLGESIATARLSSSPTFILERMRERLESVTLRPQLPTGGVPGATWQPDAARVGLDEPAAIEGAKTLAALDDPALQPNESQRRAMGKVAGSDLHFVWGPPGTGKTSALAQTARMLSERGERVLVLAHANVAVDVAMLRVADAFAGTEHLDESRILRIGDPHHAEARERAEILVETAVERRSHDVAGNVRELTERRRSLTAALRRSRGGAEADELGTELRHVREQLSAARQAFRDEASLAVADAAVIGATLSRFVLSDDVWEWSPDAILLDEASMVSFPWVLLAATRVAQRLVILGDFRQLPPVVLADTPDARKWLGSDAFEVSGVRARIDDGADDPRVTLLETQYRMAPSIAQTVSEFAYAGRLVTDPRVEETAAPLSSNEPFEGQSVVVLDTASLRPGCDLERRSGSFSRVNPLHAALGLMLADLAPGTALVTPYRAQASLFAAGIRDRLPEATAATVHRYQGSEEDCVIFDAVDALPMSGVSRLTGGDVDTALRLINVALSRARGKAVVVVDSSFIEDRLAAESPLRRAVRLCEHNGVVVDASDVLLDGLVRWARGAAADQLIAAELAVSQTEVLLNVPRDCQPSPQVIAAAGDAARRVARGLFAGSQQLVRPLQDLPCELCLLTASSHVLLVDGRVAIVGSRDLSVAARIESEWLVSALKPAVFGADQTSGRRLRAGATRHALPEG